MRLFVFLLNLKVRLLSSNGFLTIDQEKRKQKEARVENSCHFVKSSQHLRSRLWKGQFCCFLSTNFDKIQLPHRIFNDNLPHSQTLCSCWVTMNKVKICTSTKAVKMSTIELLLIFAFCAADSNSLNIVYIVILYKYDCEIHLTLRIRLERSFEMYQWWWQRIDPTHTLENNAWTLTTFSPNTAIFILINII